MLRKRRRGDYQDAKEIMILINISLPPPHGAGMYLWLFTRGIVLEFQ